MKRVPHTLNSKEHEPNFEASVKSTRSAARVVSINLIKSKNPQNIRREGRQVPETVIPATRFPHT